MSNSVSNISLYIPRIFTNFDKKDVSAVFEKLNIGKIKEIDFISKIGKDGKDYNAAYIHFHFWYNTEAANNFKERVLDEDKIARINYDDPWYWIVLENKTKKIDTNVPKSRINLGPSNSISYKSLYEITPINLSKEFKDENQMDNDYEEMEECEAMMDECEALREKEEANFAYYDRRYVKMLEEENVNLRNNLLLIQNTYLNENSN